MLMVQSLKRAVVITTHKEDRMRDRRAFLSVLLVIAVLGFGILACTGGGEPSVDEAVTARSLDDEYKPVEETTEFYPDETFYCSAEVSNLEKGAKVKAEWFFGEEFLGEYTYTAEEGGSGYVGFNLTPEETWPMGDYKVEVYLEEELARTVTFSVVPPEGATPSRVIKAVTCKEVDEEYRPVEPSTTFAPTDVVHCSVNADLGLYSQLVAKWYFEGELLEDFVTTLVLQENIADTYAHFYLEPQPELAEGDYTVEIYLDGELAKSVDFTVESPKVGFGPVVFAQGVTDDDQPINPTSTFPAGTTEVYAIFDYQGMSDSMEWVSTWYHEGEQDVSDTWVWDKGQSGTKWVRLHNDDGLPSGNWKYELHVEGQLLQSGTFVIEEAEGPSAGSVTFAAGVTEDNEPIDVATQFPVGTTIVYAFTSYAGMSDGAKCESVWYLDGEEALRSPFDWALGESGTTWIANIHGDEGLNPGRYDWELYVEGQLLQSGTFVVAQEAAIPTTIFSDDFSDPSSGWHVGSDEDVEYGYSNGEYYVLVKTPDWVAWGNPSRTFTDFRLEVDARLVIWTGNNTSGVLVRYRDERNFYLFEIDYNTGEYGVSKKVNGEWEELVAWNDSPHIKRGQSSNHLTVIAQGPNFTFYVNGELLTVVTDASFAEGDIGLLVGSYDYAGALVHFDNLEVWALP